MNESLSNSLRTFLTRKLEESKSKLIKLKRKQKIIKALYNSTTLGSITVSSVLTILGITIAVPPMVISVLSVTTGILTGVSVKFDFQSKKFEISKEIDQISKLNNKLDYVVSCNGNLTDVEFSQIKSEFM